MGKTDIELTEQVKGVLSVANGGTGQSTLTSGGVLIGAGASPVTEVNPGTNGNVLQDNGSAWVSAPLVTAPYANKITNGTSFAVPANESLYVSDEFEISNGDEVEMLSNATLEIG